MTYLGTRPILPDELEQYELHHRARIAIKPGITGMWQVSGRSDITDFEEIVRLDTEYISEWNIGLDVVLFIPMGSILTFYASGMSIKKWSYILSRCIMISLGIETRGQVLET